LNKFRSINPEQVASFLRTILQVVGGMLVANGYVSDADWTAWGGAALIIIPTIWGLWARTDTNLIKSAADVPAVKKIVAPGTEVAVSAARPKVTST
jgi:hypothetical protein